MFPISFRQHGSERKKENWFPLLAATLHVCQQLGLILCFYGDREIWLKGMPSNRTCFWNTFTGGCLCYLARMFYWWKLLFWIKKIVFNNIVFYLCLVRGILTQLAAATAMKGTQRARRGGAVWMIHSINRCFLIRIDFKNNWHKLKVHIIIKEVHH